MDMKSCLSLILTKALFPTNSEISGTNCLLVVDSTSNYAALIKTDVFKEFPSAVDLKPLNSSVMKAW